jgi:hypothetical protein
MGTTVNFIGSVDRDLLKRAKVIAAKTGTSANAIFNAALLHLVETFEAAEIADNQNFRSMVDFLLGRADASTTMTSLGIDSEEDLFLLMAQSHLPMPRIASDATRSMVDSLQALVSGT